MKGFYWVGLDVHSYSCQVRVESPGGRAVREQVVRTAIPQLRAVIEATPRPRRLVFEEGPLADWLYRNLREVCDDVLVCDPRRNALIARDGDKDDPIDARKLVRLGRGGFLRAVHHADGDDRAVLKAHVLFYHERVRRMVAAGHRLIWQLRRYGIVVTHAALKARARRRQWLTRLPADRTVRGQARMRLAEYDLLREQARQSRRRLRKLARGEPMIERFTALPGVKWVRAATCLAMIDTPLRFRKKSALWRYMGIGLERKQSGKGPVVVGVPRQCNRVLKGVILGAAKSAIAAGDNPFAVLNERLVSDGKTPRIARRTVARAMAATMWGMWKSQSDYRADLIGVPRESLTTRSHAQG